MCRSAAACTVLALALSVAGVTTVYASGVRLSHGRWLVCLDEPTWMNTSPPLGAGVRVGPAELTLVSLRSSVLNADGEGVRLRIRAGRVLGAPFIELGADHYRRGDTGGVFGAAGVNLWRENGWSFGLIATQGWTDGRVRICPSLTWEPRI